MPKDTFELRVSVRKLLIGLLVTLVPISLAGLYVITQSADALEKSIGTHFKIYAESTASGVAEFIHSRVINVGTIATEPAVLDAIQSSNRSYGGMSTAAATARIERIEKEWNTPAADAVVRDILGSRASRWLRRYQEIDRRFLRITVTDERGATVAATHKTLDYFQADEDFWQAIYAQGRGAIHLTDILYDDVTKSNYIGVGVPVLEEGTNRFLGAVDALIDVSTLFRLVNQTQAPLNLRTLLVKDDGTVISSPEATLSMGMKSGEFSAVRDALTTIQGRQTGYILSDVPDGGRHLIGFADTGLKEDYLNLGWVVLVAQDASQALAPIRAVGRLNALLALTGLAMVTLLAVYFSLHRTRPYMDLETVMRKPEEPEKTQES